MDNIFLPIFYCTDIILNLNHKNRAQRINISSTYKQRPTWSLLGCIMNSLGLQLQFLHGLVSEHTEQNQFLLSNLSNHYLSLLHTHTVHTLLSFSKKLRGEVSNFCGDKIEHTGVQWCNFSPNNLHTCQKSSSTQKTQTHQGGGSNPVYVVQQAPVMLDKAVTLEARVKTK